MDLGKGKTEGSGAEAVDQDQEVKLIVKNPYSDSGACNFSCSLSSSSTVLDVKFLLEQSYYGKPKVKHQRLVFYGKIHSDATKLEDALKGQDLTLPQTCHVIISGASAQAFKASFPSPTKDQAAKSELRNIAELQTNNSEFTQSSPEFASGAIYRSIRAPESSMRQSHLNSLYNHQQALLHQQLSATGTFGSSEGFDISSVNGTQIAARIDAAAQLSSSFHGVQLPFDASLAALSGAAFSIDQDRQASSDRVASTRKHTQNERMGSDDAKKQDNCEPVPEEDELSKEIKKLDEAYQKLLNSIALSQQLQAVSNRILFTPQPFLNSLHPISIRIQRNEVPNGADGMVPEAQNPRHDQANVEIPEAQALGEDDPARVVRRRVVVINVRLLFKLCFLVYLVGNDASYTKLAWLGGAALLYYLHELGALSYLFGVDLNFSATLDRLSQSRFVQIPPSAVENANFWTDFTVLIKTFLLSLIPSWTVRPYPEAN